MWDLRTLLQFQGRKIFPWLFQDFMDGYIKPLVDEHSVEFMTAVPKQDDHRLYPMGSQFSNSVLLNLRSQSVGA